MDNFVIVNETAQTNIHFILDRSGSMNSCINDTIGGFNSFISQQKQNQYDKAYLSLYLFDHEYITHYSNKFINDVNNLDNTSYIPRGQTALYDAIGKTITNLTHTNNESIVIVILTDGYENSSNEFSQSKIKELIEEKKKLGWEFIFLGANQDAILSASSIGIDQQSSLTFSTSNVNNCFDGVSCAVNRYRSTPMTSRKTDAIFFTQTERMKSNEDI